MLGVPSARSSGATRRGQRLGACRSRTARCSPSSIGCLTPQRGRARALLVVEITETAAISDMGRASAFCAGVPRSRLRSGARRLRRRLRLLSIPQAPPLQPPEDRRGLHPRPALLAHRPARRPGDRGHRPRHGTPDDRRVRRRRADTRNAARPTAWTMRRGSRSATQSHWRPSPPEERRGRGRSIAPTPRGGRLQR